MGGQFLDFMGGGTTVMKGDIELMKTVNHRHLARLMITDHCQHVKFTSEHK